MGLLQVYSIHTQHATIPALHAFSSHFVPQRRAYKVTDWTSPTDFLEKLAVLQGKLLKGGEPDLNTAAKGVLYDWQRGRLPYFTLPPGWEAPVHSVVEQDGGGTPFPTSGGGAQQAGEAGEASRRGGRGVMRKKRVRRAESGDGLQEGGKGAVEYVGGPREAANKVEGDLAQIGEEVCWANCVGQPMGNVFLNLGDLRLCAVLVVERIVYLFCSYTMISTSRSLKPIHHPVGIVDLSAFEIAALVVNFN